MNALMREMRLQNGDLRGLTGSGQPGLHTLLGGTAPEQDASGLRFGGGPGQVSATARLAEAHRDLRLAAVAGGSSVPSGGGGGMGGDRPDRPGGGGTRLK